MKKKFKSSLSVIIVLVVLLSSISVLSLEVVMAESKQDYVEYIDFGEDYAKTGTEYLPDPADNYSRAKLVNERIVFSNTTNAGNTFGYRAFLATNDRKSKNIKSGKTYKVTFDFITSASSLKSYTFVAALTDGVWASSYLPKATLDTLTVENTQTTASEKIYTLSYIFDATSASDANLAISIYANETLSSPYYVDDVYIYEGNNYYTVKDGDSNELCSILGFPNSNTYDTVIKAGLEKTGYDLSVSPEKFPNDTNKDIVVTYTPKENLVQYIDFNKDYAKNDRVSDYPNNKYIIKNTGYAEIVSEKAKFFDTANTSVDFKNRAVLLSNSADNDILVKNKKYRIDFDLKCINAVENYTVELKFASNLQSTPVVDGITLSGTELSEKVISSKQAEDTTTVYTVSFDFEAPENTNPLISVCGTNCSYLDNVCVRKFSTYSVVDTDGQNIGSIIGFAGDTIDLAANDAVFHKDEYRYELNTDTFPLSSKDKIEVKYTGISILEEIDFSSKYAAKHRSTGYPSWQYVSNATTSSDARVTYQDGQILFKGIVNSGNSYGNRSVLLSNDYRNVLLEKGKKYQLVFDLLLKAESLSSKTVDLRFGDDVWDNIYSGFKNPVKADELELLSQTTEGAYTCYTLMYEFVAPTNQNALISIYGNGNCSDFLLKNVVIYQPIGFVCTDEAGNDLTDENGNVLKLYAFPGEKLDEDFLAGTSVDKIDMFEEAVPNIAPDKSVEKIKIIYTKDESYIDSNDFSSDVYFGADKAKYFVQNQKISVADEKVKIAINATSETYRNRSFVIAKDYQNTKFVAGKKYTIDFDLEIPKTQDIKEITIELRSGVSAGNGLGSAGNKYADSNPLTITGEQLAKSVISEKISTTDSSKKIYKISVSYTLAEESKWGTNTLRNILMSVSGNKGNASVDNIEIVKKSSITLENTSLDKLVGRIGHKLVLPEDVSQKGYVFDGWYADKSLETPANLTVYPNEDKTVYAKMFPAVTDTNMTFTFAPPSVADMTNFSHSLFAGNIYANTDTANTSYIKLYKDSDAIRMTNLNYYPISLKYKTEKIDKFTLGFAVASKDNFNKAKTVLYSKTYSNSDDWTSVDMCLSPEFTFDNGVKGDYIYLFVEYSSISGGKIYIDDVVLTKETSISFDTNGGNKINDIVGEPGTKAVLPTPVKSGKTFTGWYYDKDLISKVTDVNYPVSKCKMTLYASWDNNVSNLLYDDKEDIKELDFSNNDRASQVFSLNHTYTYSGDTSIKYSFDPKTTKSITSSESTYQLGNIKVEKGKTYGLTMYVYAKELNSHIDVHAYTADENNVMSNTAQVTNSVGVAVISDKMFPKEKWQKVDYVFTANNKNETADTLYLSITPAQSVKNEIYIDLVTVTEFDENMGAVGFNTSVYDNKLVDFEYNYAYGKVGSVCKNPVVSRENYVLEGWYSEYRYMNEFDMTFTQGVRIAHPQWDIDGEVKVSLENIADYQRDGTGTGIQKFTNQGGGEVVVGEKASDGNAAYKVEGTKSVNWEKALALKESDGSPFRIVDGKSYVIFVDIYIEKYGSDFGFNFTTGSQDNFYAWQGSSTGSITVNGDTPTGKWITTALTITGSFGAKGGFNLFLRNTVSGNSDTVVYFDNFRIQSLDPVNPTIIINKGLIAGDVDMISGKPGTPYKLPDTVYVPGYDFAGWFSSPAMTKTVDAEGVFLETKTVYAKLIPKKFVNDFEESQYNFQKNTGGDMDYEIYDKNEQGHSAANVHGGNKSLHRIGNDYQHKNVVVVQKNATLAVGEAYELSMWVKMDRYDHTNGAIKIASCSAKNFAWDLVGDMQAVIPIKDLTDGKWHYVTYKFMSSAYYLSLQTPGYCSIYIDDITITHLSEPIKSASPAYTEYIPIEKDANGNIPKIVSETDEKFADTRLNVYEDYQKKLDKLNNMEDDDEYDDDEYDENSSVNRVKKKSTTVTRKRNPLTFKDILICNSYVWYTVVFYVGVGVLLAGIGLVIFLILWKKRKKGGK